MEVTIDPVTGKMFIRTKSGTLKGQLNIASVLNLKDLHEKIEVTKKTEYVKASLNSKAIPNLL